MKCKICREKAVAELPQHRMALCHPCYLDWFPGYAKKTIKKFKMLDPGDRILVAISGGKDSGALWRVLVDLGYAADAMIIDLGIGDRADEGLEGEGYSSNSTAYAREQAAGLGRDLWVIDLREHLGRSVPQLRRGQRPVCSACGLVKRYLMNRAALEGGYDCVATGHNLDDEVGALFGNVLTWDSHYLSRQGPVSPQRGERLMKKVKPFCYFTERETAMYALLADIPYMREECPNAVGATTITYKELINRLESQAPGTKRRFYDGFLGQRDLFREDDEVELRSCQSCGMPSPLETCGFCRLVGDVPVARYGALQESRVQRLESADGALGA
jgi:uncharacterized protein (TIGR00269 family)